MVAMGFKAIIIIFIGFHWFKMVSIAVDILYNYIILFSNIPYVFGVFLNTDLFNFEYI